MKNTELENPGGTEVVIPYIYTYILTTTIQLQEKQWLNKPRYSRQNVSFQNVLQDQTVYDDTRKKLNLKKIQGTVHIVLAGLHELKLLSTIYCFISQFEKMVVINIAVTVNTLYNYVIILKQAMSILLCKMMYLHAHQSYKTCSNKTLHMWKRSY